MLLKAHVRFLGASSAAMRCCYPTRERAKVGAAPREGRSSIWARRRLRVGYADQYRNGGSKPCG